MNITITAIIYAVFSWHSVCGYECNQNNNPSLGFEAEHRTGKYIIMTANNSHCKQSVLIAKRFKYAIAGFVSGYSDHPIPIAAPMIDLGPVDIGCLTDFRDNTVCLAAFKWSF